MLEGKQILLIIGGGIAAYKSLELIRLLGKSNAGVTPVLTAAGGRFVTQLSVSSLAKAEVHCDLFDAAGEVRMGHIELSRSADLIVVAPATADLIAKMANGNADDLASTVLLATDKRVVVAPAMNVRMWQHPATRRNIARIRSDGISVVGPSEGEMACGEFGPGRMADPEEILAAVVSALSSGPMRGFRAIVTSGPTFEMIDPVRYIANRSSGLQGKMIACALRDLGAEVDYVTGPSRIEPPEGVSVSRVESAKEMLAAVLEKPTPDVAVFAAAVSDWGVEKINKGKIKKSPGNPPPTLHLVENPDILKRVSGMKDLRPKLVVGFAAETENLESNARAKLENKGCDWIVANNVRPENRIIDGIENEVLLITREKTESWPRMSKAEVANRLSLRICEALAH